MIREYVVKVTDALVPDAFQRFENEWSPEQEVVRCKDCKHKGISYECILDRDLEEYGSHRTQEYDNWYCADGERRDETT